MIKIKTLILAASISIAVLFAAGCNDTDLPTCAVDWQERVWSESDYAKLLDDPHDVLIVTLQQIEKGKIDIPRIRAAAPDMHVLSYVTMSVNHRWMQYAPVGSFGRDWYEMGMQHLAFTTEGDTASVWVPNYVIDVSDSLAVQAMIGVLAAHSVDCDGYMLDYCTANTTGPPLPDMVGTALGWWDVDQKALRDGWCYLVDSLRWAIPGKLIIPNGRLARYDAGFAGRCDGIYFETHDISQVRDIYPSLRFRPGGFSIFEQIDGSLGAVRYAVEARDAYGVVKSGVLRRLVPVPTWEDVFPELIQEPEPIQYVIWEWRGVEGALRYPVDISYDGGETFQTLDVVHRPTIATRYSDVVLKVRAVLEDGTLTDYGLISDPISTFRLFTRDEVEALGVRVTPGY